MHDSCPCLLRRIDISASLLSVFNRQPTGGLFMFDDQLIFCPPYPPLRAVPSLPPGGLYVRARVLCCPALHHLPVPENHNCWCAFHLRTAEVGLTCCSGVLSSRGRTRRSTWLFGGRGGCTPTHVTRELLHCAVNCKGKMSISCSARWPLLQAVHVMAP